MSGKRIVVVGGGRLGCELALGARQAGHAVTLIDEHPQSIKAMSLDAPYFYGNGLPAALRNRVSVHENVLTANEPLMACAEAEVDVRTGAVAWGVFQNGPNSLHIGTPKVGIVTESGNEMIEYDHLVLATGSRDFVPSFRGWELPGVFGVKAGLELLTAYQCYDGTRTLILGTTAEAVAFARIASDKGIAIAGFVEPTDTVQASAEDHDWIHEQDIEIFFNTVIEGANGSTGTTFATLISTGSDGAKRDVACDTICIAIGKLPNVELPGSMGCRMAFSERFGAWLPETSGQLEMTRPNAYWLSGYNQASDRVERVLSAIREIASGAAQRQPLDDAGLTPAAYMRTWVQALLRTGGRDVTLCQCETVTRGELLDLSPPKYLGSGSRQPKSPVRAAPDGARIDQDLVKRMTRVGMGHCQGKRCRDEATLLLSEELGVDLARIKPATYRIPVRPIDLALIAAEDDAVDTRERWPHWLEPYVQAE